MLWKNIMRTQVKSPKTHHHNYLKTLVIILPRITEWLNRKELLKRYELEIANATNVLIWIKKQNRYQILKGAVDELILDKAEALVHDIKYDHHLFINNSSATFSLRNN